MLSSYCCRSDRDSVGLLMNLQMGFKLVLQLLVHSCWLQSNWF